jgi:hypothetical protein
MLRRVCLQPTLVALSIAAAPAIVRAEPPSKEQCIEANVETQRFRLAGKLRQARRAAIVCSSAACPAPVQAECAGWVRQLDQQLPRVVFHAFAANGRRLAQVRVFVDGELVATQLDGRSVPVDPGTHQFRFVRADGSELTLRETVAEGQLRRSLDARFVDAPAPQAEARREPADESFSPVVPLLGVGVLGAASFAFFALRGSALERERRDDCAPNCTRDETLPVRTSYIIADVSLGISLLALGAAAWFAFSDPAPRSAKPPALLSGRF